MESLPTSHALISPNGAESYCIPEGQGIDGVHLQLPGCIADWQEILHETEMGVKSGIDTSYISTPRHLMGPDKDRDYPRRTTRGESWRTGLAGPPLIYPSFRRMFSHQEQIAPRQRRAQVTRPRLHAVPLEQKRNAVCISRDWALRTRGPRLSTLLNPYGRHKWNEALLQDGRGEYSLATQSVCR